MLETDRLRLMAERVQMSGPQKVLHVLNGLHAGGIQAFLVSLHGEIDPSIVQFDYLLRYADEGVYEPVVRELGGSVFHVPYSTKHPIRAKKSLCGFFKSHPYQIVHFHYGFLQDMMPIAVAKQLGTSTRIMHAHSANYEWRGIRERIFQIQHEVNKKIGVRLATDWFACSVAAARWFSFEDNILGEGWRFIPNGVEVNQFEFDPLARSRIRSQLGIGANSLCLGNVGRLSTTKNQEFLLDVFRQLLNMGHDADLIIVGGGELGSQLKRKAAQLELGDRIHFVGETAGAKDYYNAMDLFVFPSIAEGLGMAAVEAQANGLPCIVSEAIPKEALICDTTAVLSLRQSAQEWADAVVGMKNTGRNCSNAALVRSAGYDVKDVAQELTKFYCDAALRSEGSLQHA